jgi:hypothetical protein
MSTHPSKEKILHDWGTRKLGVEEDTIQEIFQSDTTGFEERGTKFEEYTFRRKGRESISGIGK